jgi:D-alanyl-D-alanine carboxypeptidase
MNYKLKLFLLITTILVASCKIQTHQSSKAGSTFQPDLDSQINENMPGILVTVISKEKDIDWSGASGYSDKVNKTKLLPHQTFRMASVTKTFVAATILRLWEDKKLELDDPIEKYISNEHNEILRKGGYNPQEITIFHLLTHSSGLSEHTRSEKYQLSYLKTNHIWTRTEQLTDLITFTKPVGEAGKQFSYSDSGYILLGEIIEAITHRSLGEAIEEQLNLKKLGLRSIHIEDAKGEFTAKRIHQYYENEDTYYINPTFDLYGGGGLLSSTRDLSLFYQYLFENKVFHNKATLTRMLTSVNYPTKPILDYRLGIWETEIEGLPAYTHSGFWGTQVVYIPGIKASIAVNYSQYWNKKGIAPVIPQLVKQLSKK